MRQIMDLPNKGTLNIHWVMYLTQRARASDPRDRVYAMLSLVK